MNNFVARNIQGKPFPTIRKITLTDEDDLEA
jgi:hypothetical protein